MTIYHIKFQNISTKSLTILKILKRSVIWLQSGISSFIRLEMAKKKKKKSENIAIFSFAILSKKENFCRKRG